MSCATWLPVKLEHAGLPFAPIGRTDEMFEDPHLLASGGLADLTLPDGTETRLPTLPLEMDGRRSGSSSMLTRPGDHTSEVLRDAGFTPREIESLAKKRVIG